MNDKREDKKNAEERHREVSQRIGKKEKRRLKAREEDKGGSVWFGLSMFGLVGWSVTIPSLIGIAVGIWLDTRFDSGVTWTMAGLIIGVAVGSAAAWYWIKQEGHRK